MFGHCTACEEPVLEIKTRYEGTGDDRVDGTARGVGPPLKGAGG